MNWLELVLFSLASFRLTHLLVFDKITGFIRKPFHEEVEEMEEDGSTSVYIKIKGTGIRYWIGDLLSCYWCTGIWTTATLYVLWRIWPVLSEPIIVILAIAGGAAIIESIVLKINQ